MSKYIAVKIGLWFMIVFIEILGTQYLIILNSGRILGTQYLIIGSVGVKERRGSSLEC